MGKASCVMLSGLAALWLSAGAHALAAEPPAHASGGVGDDDPLLSITGDYNLQLIFAAQGSGEYLADVKVLINDAGGRPLLDAVSPGPRFYVRLPAATYQINVEYAGKTLQRSLTLVDRRPQSVYFHWPRSADEAAAEPATGPSFVAESPGDADSNRSDDVADASASVAAGWRELALRSGAALTRFSPVADEPPPPAAESLPYPRWGLLPAEVAESAREIVVRVELPGMEKSDFQLRIEGQTLIVSGTKRVERSGDDATVHVSERGYGAFERIIALPTRVVDEQAEAGYRNGVLTVRLPKQEPAPPRSIPVS